MQLILLYSLKDGVSRDEFHTWVRTVDQRHMALSLICKRKMK